MPEILIVYYSRNGAVAQLARHIARGVEEVPGMRARLRSVPPVAPVTQTAQPPEPADGAPYAIPSELLLFADAAGLTHALTRRALERLHVEGLARLDAPPSYVQRAIDALLASQPAQR